MKNMTTTCVPRPATQLAEKKEKKDLKKNLNKKTKTKNMKNMTKTCVPRSATQWAEKKKKKDFKKIE